MRFYVRYRANDKDVWTDTDLMSKEKADDTAEFLNRFGFIARVCFFDMR